MTRNRGPFAELTRSFRRALMALAGATLALTLAAPSAKAAAPAKKSIRNVVLISIDTLRADHVGCYGAPAGSTPNIDRLAARGVRFEHAYSAAPITTPSHATIFSGTYPPTHGVRSNGSAVLPADRPTIAEIFQGKGFETAAFLGAFPLDHQFGFGRGFELYDDDIAKAGSSHSRFDAERRAETVVDHALGWYKRRNRSRPFFLFVHCYDPHRSYIPPEPYRSRYAKDPYRGEIAYTDDQVGRLIRSLEQDGRLDDTLFVLLSDHGEGLGEHGEATHMLFVYDSTLRVPLIISGPGVPKGKTLAEPARLVDILPTLVHAVGAQVPIEVQGVDLSPAWSAARTPLPSKRIFYAESMVPQVEFGWAPLESVRSGRWKYIHAPKEELYDLEADPGESKNLFADQPEAASDMRRLLKRAERELAGSEVKADDTPPLDAEAIAKLQSLGYLASSGGASTKLDPMSLPDPKTRVSLLNRFEDARFLENTGRTDDAIDAYRQLLDEYPKEDWLDLVLASALLHEQRSTELLGLLGKKRIAKLEGKNLGRAVLLRAQALEQQSRWGEALKEWEALSLLGKDGASAGERGRKSLIEKLTREGNLPGPQ